MNLRHAHPCFHRTLMSPLFALLLLSALPETAHAIDSAPLMNVNSSARGVRDRVQSSFNRLTPRILSDSKVSITRDAKVALSKLISRGVDKLESRGFDENDIRRAEANLKKMANELVKQSGPRKEINRKTLLKTLGIICPLWPFC